jgi:hypothetical protein
MLLQRPNYEFNAEDHKVYTAWLRRILAVYGALVLFGIAVVTVQATTHTTNVANAVAQALP